MKGRTHLSRRQAGVCIVLGLVYFVFLGRALWHRYRAAAFGDAVGHGDYKRVERLMRWGSVPNQGKPNMPYVEMAIARNDKKMALLLLRAGDFPQIGPCRLASGGLLDVLEQKLRNGANANENCGGMSILMRAAELGPEATALLMDHGADVNYVEPAGMIAGETALTRAILTGNRETVRLLLDRGARTDIWYTLLTSPPGGLVRVRIPNAAPIHASPAYKNLGDAAYPTANAPPITPLMHAAMRGEAEIVDLLLEHGARINDRDAAGRTALTLAEGLRQGHRHPQECRREGLIAPSSALLIR